MANIKETKTLVKRIYFANFFAGDGLAITPLLPGRHGIGKTQIVHEAAKDLGGICLVVEGGSLKEGEITGLPFAMKTENGESEVRFVRYYSINQIRNLEKEYYDRAASTGYLDGKVKLVVNPETTMLVETVDGKTTEKEVSNTLTRILAGEDNKYKFGKELSARTKMALIESGEIRPVFLFIDELNRTEQQTMKELMNIILNRSVNGYELPWWVCIVSAINPCSQNSTYATNEMDDAQLDRFLTINVDAKLTDWIDYALAKGIDTRVVEAIATTEDIFLGKGNAGYKNENEPTPSPRSWEMVSIIYSSINEINKLRFFDDEERKSVNDHLRVLIRGKVGDSAARTFLQNIANHDNHISPEEIINGKTPEIEPRIVSKYNGLKALHQKIIAESIIRYLCEKMPEFEKKRKDEKDKTYKNVMSQIKQFVTSVMPQSVTMLFAKKVAEIDKCKCSDNSPLFMKIASCFAKEMLSDLKEFKSAIQKLNGDN